MKCAAMTCAIAVLVGLPAVPASASSCDSLLTLGLKDTTITLAQLVPAGQFSSPGERQGAGRGVNPYTDLSEFCRVAATLRPTSDSEIKVEVWLPARNWNGKFQAVGNGGWAGVISYSAMAEAVRAGYASASTDTGHVGGRGTFALDHPEKLIDFAWRSEHEMTVKAKAVIQAFYGSAPKLSYWNGCSTGGRQGLKEAQKFPDDYDAIIAGAPANRTAISLWIAAAVLKDPASYIPPSKYPVIHQAALAACDARDGLKDGLIDDPTKCAFDPEVLLCKGPDGPALSDRSAGGRGAKDLFSRHQPAYRTAAVLVAGAGNRVGLGRSGPGSGPFGQHLRSVSIRRLQGPQVGLEDVQFRQRCGARRPAGEPGHECHRSEHEAVLLARRETAALSRLERPECPDA